MMRPGLVLGVGLLLPLLVIGCSGEDGSPPSEPAERRDLRVEQISAGTLPQGPVDPRAVVAASAADLTRASGVEVPEAGSGTYLTLLWGEQPTGGYSLAVRAARVVGDRVEVRLRLEEPPPGEIVTDALTYPYAAAVLRDLDPEGKTFAFVDQDGRRLGWPVRRTGTAGGP